MAEHWNTSNRWDICQIGEDILPGVCKIKPTGRRVDVDVQKSKGKDKPVVSIKGRGPAELEITVHVVGPSRYAEWEDMADRLDPPPGSEISPKPIVHPAAQTNHIDEVLILEVDRSVPNSLEDLYVKIRCIEYSDKPKPTKVNKTPELTAFELEWRETEGTKQDAESAWLDKQQQLDDQLASGEIGIDEYDAQQTEAEDEYLDKLDAADADQAVLEESGWEDYPDDADYFEQLTDSDEL